MHNRKRRRGVARATGGPLLDCREPVDSDAPAAAALPRRGPSRPCKAVVEGGDGSSGGGAAVTAAGADAPAADAPAPAPATGESPSKRYRGMAAPAGDATAGEEDFDPAHPATKEAEKGHWWTPDEDAMMVNFLDRVGAMPSRSSVCWKALAHKFKPPRPSGGVYQGARKLAKQHPGKW